MLLYCPDGFWGKSGMIRAKMHFAILLLVLSAVLGAGCRKGSDKVFFVGPTNEPPAIATVPGQNAVEGSPFSLDLSAYVSDDHDAVPDLTFGVVSGIIYTWPYWPPSVLVSNTMLSSPPYSPPRCL